MFVVSPGTALTHPPQLIALSVHQKILMVYSLTPVQETDQTRYATEPYVLLLTVLSASQPPLLVCVVILSSSSLGCQLHAGNLQHVCESP